MKRVIVLHNPGAGDEDHFRTELMKDIEKEGFNATYFSIKKDDSWVELLGQSDFIVVAGGDGTVRRVARELVQRDVLDKKLPLAILPMGTANNLSRTLGIDPGLDNIHHIRNWKDSKRQVFDLGVIGQGDDTDFFLEGAGYGVFPVLMQQMNAIGDSGKKNPDTAEDKLRLALEQLHDLILTWKAEKYELKTDNEIHEGKFILLEVMNIRSIGPRLTLCPEAVTDDGYLDVVCIEEDQRDEFAAYIQSLLDDHPLSLRWKTIRTKKATLHCESRYMHLDDELIQPAPSYNPVVFEARENILEFMVTWEH